MRHTQRQQGAPSASESHSGDMNHRIVLIEGVHLQYPSTPTRFLTYRSEKQGGSVGWGRAVVQTRSPVNRRLSSKHIWLYKVTGVEGAHCHFTFTWAPFRVTIKS